MRNIKNVDSYVYNDVNVHLLNINNKGIKVIYLTHVTSCILFNIKRMALLNKTDNFSGKYLFHLFFLSGTEEGNIQLLHFDAWKSK